MDTVHRQRAAAAAVQAAADAAAAHAAAQLRRRGHRGSNDDDGRSAASSGSRRSRSGSVASSNSAAASSVALSAHAAAAAQLARGTHAARQSLLLRQLEAVRAGDGGLFQDEGVLMLYLAVKQAVLESMHALWAAAMGVGRPTPTSASSSSSSSSAALRVAAAVGAAAEALGVLAPPLPPLVATEAAARMSVYRTNLADCYGAWPPAVAAEEVAALGAVHPLDELRSLLLTSAVPLLLRARFGGRAAALGADWGACKFDMEPPDMDDLLGGMFAHLAASSWVQSGALFCPALVDPLGVDLVLRDAFRWAAVARCLPVSRVEFRDAAGEVRGVDTLPSRRAAAAAADGGDDRDGAASASLAPLPLRGEDDEDRGDAFSDDDVGVDDSISVVMEHLETQRQQELDAKRRRRRHAAAAQQRSSDRRSHRHHEGGRSSQTGVGRGHDDRHRRHPPLQRAPAPTAAAAAAATAAAATIHRGPRLVDIAEDDEDDEEDEEEEEEDADAEEEEDDDDKDDGTDHTKSLPLRGVGGASSDTVQQPHSADAATTPPVVAPPLPAPPSIRYVPLPSRASGTTAARRGGGGP